MSQHGKFICREGIDVALKNEGGGHLCVPACSPKGPGRKLVVVVAWGGVLWRASPVPALTPCSNSLPTLPSPLAFNLSESLSLAGA